MFYGFFLLAFSCHSASRGAKWNDFALEGIPKVRLT